jgi:TolA-binding protein
MNPDQKFPVEPLPDAAWNRIERAVFERAQAGAAVAQAKRQPARRWALLVAAAVLLAVGGLFWSRSLQRAELARMASTRIVADEGFTETLLDDVLVRLEPASALVVVDQGVRGSLVLLERGNARFSVPPRAGRPPFAVQAGEVRVEVVGTRFRVLRQGGLVRVEDDEGRVRVTADGQSTLLEPGASWSNRALTPTSEVEARASARAQSPEARTAPVAKESSRPALKRAASAPLASALEEKVAPLPASAEAAGAELARGGLSQTERFEQAARLEASDPEAAQRGYASLVAEGGRWGETALYAQGRLALERGEHEHARELLQRYLSLYPRGANVADVHSLLGPLEQRRRPELK